MGILAELEAAIADAGPAAAFDRLFEHLKAEKRYAHLFEARLMRRRHELGLPLIEAAPSSSIPAELRAEWEPFVVGVARETGEMYLAAGDIARAWPYFRALGEPEPVRAAIERLDPAAGGSDEIIGVALEDRVHPVRGYQMLLATHGACRAITCMDRYPDPDSREAALALLARSLHDELRANLARVIEKQEGAPPSESASIPELVAGRDWLFGEYDYYIDTSHLLSILRFAADSESAEVWRIAADLAAYGRRLGPMFQLEGEPPFEKPFLDYGIFIEGLLGRDADGAIAHFTWKAEETDPEVAGTYPAQLLVRYLLRLGRPQQAIDVFERHLRDSDPAYLTCPGLAQLCQLAGDWQRMQRLGLEKNDALTYLAALAQRNGRESTDHE